MKRFLSLMLALLLVLGLCACGSGSGAQGNAGNQGGGDSGLAEGQLLAGYSKVNITPEDPVPLSGFGNTDQRISTGFTEYIWATCVAVTDASGNTAIFIGLDLVSTSATVFTTLREAIAEKLEIPQSNVVLSASHMHSGPDMDSQLLSIQRYLPLFSQYIMTVVEEAMADRAPADLYISSIETEGLNFVRRYVLEGNIYAGYQSDISESGLAIIGHESDADGELQLLKFDRAEDKTDILMANFQTHPHRGDGSSNTLINANLVGAFRDAMEERMGYDVLYFTGASGNINPVSQIEHENITANYTEQGQMLAKYAIDAEATYEKISGGTVQSTTGHFEGLIDHSQDHMVSIAKEAQALWKKTNSVSAVRAEFLSQGIHSPYHANAIVSKSIRGEKEGFDVWAISIGDISFAVAPYEMFDTNGMFIKDNSPYKMTFIVTVANGGNGYFPSLESCQHGGYEPDTTKYVHGSAETLANIYVDLMNELYPKR